MIRCNPALRCLRGSYLRLVRLIHPWGQGVWQAQPAQLDVGYAPLAAERVLGTPSCAVLRPAAAARVHAAVPQRWDLQRQHLQKCPQPAHHKRLRFRSCASLSVRLAEPDEAALIGVCQMYRRSSATYIQPADTLAADTSMLAGP